MINRRLRALSVFSQVEWSKKDWIRFLNFQKKMKINSLKMKLTFVIFVTLIILMKNKYLL